MKVRKIAPTETTLLEYEITGEKLDHIGHEDYINAPTRVEYVEGAWRKRARMENRRCL